MTETGLQSEILATAQSAINLPEVQEIVKRLAAYNLGVFMPHMHDTEGGMEPLPDGIVQVEDDLRVSFQPESNVIGEPGKSYLPVGWRWSAETQSCKAVTHCPLIQVNGQWKHSGVQQTH